VRQSNQSANLFNRKSITRTVTLRIISHEILNLCKLSLRLQTWRCSQNARHWFPMKINLLIHRTTLPLRWLNTCSLIIMEKYATWRMLWFLHNFHRKMLRKVRPQKPLASPFYTQNSFTAHAVSVNVHQIFTFAPC